MHILVADLTRSAGKPLTRRMKLLKCCRMNCGAQIIKREIPTSFARGTAEEVRQTELCRSELVLNVGQPAGRQGRRNPGHAADGYYRSIGSCY